MGQAAQLVPAGNPVHYERRRPEETALYQLLLRPLVLLSEKGRLKILSTTQFERMAFAMEENETADPVHGPVGTKLQYEDIWRWALPELRPARRMQQDLLLVAHKIDSKCHWQAAGCDCQRL